MSPARARKPPSHEVRRNLIESAIHIAAIEGLANASVQNIANHAGVSKSGLFYHFRSKEELLRAAYAELIQNYDAHIEQLMAEDKNPQGRFSRAYITASLDFSSSRKTMLSAGLIILMLRDAEIRKVFNEWLNGRLEKHKDTDSAPHLEIARLAADGFWFSTVLHSRDPGPAECALLLQNIRILTKA